MATKDPIELKGILRRYAPQDDSRSDRRIYAIRSNVLLPLNRRPRADGLGLGGGGAGEEEALAVCFFGRAGRQLHFDDGICAELDGLQCDGVAGLLAIRMGGRQGRKNTMGAFGNVGDQLQLLRRRLAPQGRRFGGEGPGKEVRRHAQQQQE